MFSIASRTDENTNNGIGLHYPAETEGRPTFFMISEKDPVTAF